MDNGQKKTSFFSNWADKSFFGYTLREVALLTGYPLLKTLAVWPTQPLAKIAGDQQVSVKEGQPLTFVQSTQRIYAKQGISGFWNASVASANRMFVQSLYKGPLQVVASDISKKVVSDDTTGLHFFRGLVTGSIVGITDPMLLAPLERYKTWKLLQQGQSENFIGYIKNICQQQNNNPHGVLKELYRGLGVTVVKQTMMNGTLFITKGWASEFVKPYEKEHPIASMAFSSVLPGMAAAGVGAPADLIKSLIQQHTGKNLTVKELFKATIEKSGWKGLFTGLPAKFVLIASGYATNALFLNLFEKYRNADKNGRNEPPTSSSPKEGSAGSFMEQVRQNATNISSDEEKLLAECAPHITDGVAEWLAELHYDNLPSEQAVQMLSDVMPNHEQMPSNQSNKFTLEELFNLSEEELTAIPPHELALRMPRGGIIALLARVVVTYENQQILDELSQISSKQLADFSDEELERFHAQLFGALLNHPPQTKENTLQKRLLDGLIQQFENLDIQNNNPRKEKSPVNLAEKNSLLFSVLKENEESDAHYFARLAQRAGDENMIFGDFMEFESSEDSKKRTLSIE